MTILNAMPLDLEVAGEAALVFIDHRHKQMPCLTCGRLYHLRHCPR